MNRYTILMALLAILWGTEAGAIPSYQAQYLIDDPPYTTFGSGSLSIDTLTQYNFNTPTNTTYVEFIFNGFASSPEQYVYIDNIQLVEQGVDGDPDITHNINFDGLVGNDQLFSGLEIAGVRIDVFGGNNWFNSTTFGNQGPSIYGESGSTDLRLIITIPIIGQDNGKEFSFGKIDMGYGGPHNASVPEPTSLMLLGAGLAGIGIWRRKVRGEAEGV